MADGENGKKRIAWFCVPAHGQINPTIKLLKEMKGPDMRFFILGLIDLENRWRVWVWNLSPVMDMMTS